MAQLQSSFTEIHKILDLSDVIDQFESHQTEKAITLKIPVDKMLMIIDFYPKYNAALNGYCALFNRITSQLIQNTGHDHRVSIVYQCGDATRQFNESLHRFKGGQSFGWKNAFTLEHIKKHKQIAVRIQINHKKSSTKSAQSSFMKQLENMYKISKLNGDIKLIVKLNQNDNNLYFPPHKKRKLNAFECEVCMKSFNSNKGLKSHISNQKDAAHKKYKKNRNKNNNDGLDGLDGHDFEISYRMSGNMLRSASIVFDRILAANMREQKEKCIEIHAESEKDVDDLLYFVCTNQLRYDCNALTLIQLAHYYEMDRLVCDCANKLLENVSIENFVQIIKIFDKYEISDGYGLLVDFGKKNAEKLQNEDDFNGLSHSLKCILLNSIKK